MCGRARAATASETRAAANDIRRQRRPAASQEEEEESNEQASSGSNEQATNDDDDDDTTIVFDDASAFVASANAHPGRQLGVVMTRDAKTVEARAMSWGLGARKWNTFNARSETAAVLPTFRKLYAKKHGGRAVAVLQGFYEWTEGALKQKQPYYARRENGDLLLVAALCDDDSCTLLTRDVVPSLAWLHDRMPVIFPDAAAAARWLDDDVPHKIEPPPLATHPVHPKMSKITYQDDDANTPMKPPKKITDFFKPTNKNKTNFIKEKKQQPDEDDDAKETPRDTPKKRRDSPDDTSSPPQKKLKPPHS